MIKIQLLKGVRNFEKLQQLIFVLTNQIIVISGKEIHDKIPIDTQFYGSIGAKDLLISKGENRFIYATSNKKLDEIYLPKGSLPRFKHFKEFILQEKNEKGERLIIKYDLETKKVLWKKDFDIGQFILVNSILVGMDILNKEIYFINFDTGETVNFIDISKISSNSEESLNKPIAVSKTLGTHDGILWLTLRNSTLVGFKVENPSELYRIELPEYFLHTYHIQQSQLDVVNKMIFGLFGSYYWEIDLDSKEYKVKVIDISSEINRTGIKPSPKGMGSWPFTNEYIYFGQGGAWADDDAYVGKFNRKTKKIDWSSKEMGKEGTFKGINNLAFANEHLYVLDYHKTLHILSE